MFDRTPMFDVTANIVTDALAAARLTRLVVDDRVTARARQAWWDRHGWPQSGGVSYAIACPACVGLWVALAAECFRGRHRSVTHALAVAALIPPLVGVARTLEQTR